MSAKNPISFTKKVKDESAKAERTPKEKRALLSAFARLNGYLSVGSDSFELASDSSATAKCIYSYLRDLYGVSARFAYTRSSGFLKQIVYHILIDKDAKKILDDLEVDYFFASKPKEVISTSEEVAAYLTGAFLASGSVNDPHSRSYHLEITLNDETYAHFLMKVWNHFPAREFHAKVGKRRKQYLVYLKRGEEISDFLILLKAKEQCFAFEDVRMGKDLSNNTNRLSNLDASNYERSQKAGEKQASICAFFLEKYGFDVLDKDNPKMAALIQLRISHPDASLTELATLLSEELNTSISKSNVNHLFRALRARYALEKNNG